MKIMFSHQYLQVQGGNRETTVLENMQWRRPEGLPGEMSKDRNPDGLLKTLFTSIDSLRLKVRKRFRE